MLRRCRGRRRIQGGARHRGRAGTVGKPSGAGTDARTKEAPREHRELPLCRRRGSRPGEGRDSPRRSRGRPPTPRSWSALGLIPTAIPSPRAPPAAGRCRSPTPCSPPSRASTPGCAPGLLPRRAAGSPPSSSPGDPRGSAGWSTLRRPGRITGRPRAGSPGCGRPSPLSSRSRTARLSRPPRGPISTPSRQAPRRPSSSPFWSPPGPAPGPVPVSCSVCSQVFSSTLGVPTTSWGQA